MKEHPNKERLAKVLADRGLCSRRSAEPLIQAGDVWVNGTPHTNLAEKVDINAEITVKGKPLQKKLRLRVWLFHKPPQMVCTHDDPQQRETVFSYVKKQAPELPRVISIGRLDYLSEGLLILTNTGSFARHLELPTNNFKRCYDVKIQKELPSFVIDRLKKGITIEGVSYESIDVKKLVEQNWYRFTLQEGKNREIRRVLKHFNIPLARLKRISYGPFRLGTLKKGEISEVPPVKLKEFKS